MTWGRIFGVHRVKSIERCSELWRGHVGALRWCNVTRRTVHTSSRLIVPSHVWTFARVPSKMERRDGEMKRYTLQCVRTPRGFTGINKAGSERDTVMGGGGERVKLGRADFMAAAPPRVFPRKVWTKSYRYVYITINKNVIRAYNINTRWLGGRCGGWPVTHTSFVIILVHVSVQCPA